MSPRSLTSSLLLVLAMVACTDPSSPPSISAQFVLVDVDGHPLPATPPSSSGAPGPTLVSGTMVLDIGGTALISEDRVAADGTLDNVTNHFTYTIKDSNITFDFQVPCPINGICVAPPTGQILDNGLRVQIVFPPGSAFQIYNYRVSATP
jgi:hypothetical protein